MAIVLRQVAHASGAGISTLSKAYTSTTLPGSLLICWAVNNQVTDFTSIVESLGDSIQTAIAYTGDTNTNEYLRLLYCENTVGGACTWTLNNTNHTGAIQMIIAEYTGVAPTGSLDKVSVRATGHNTSPTTSALTPVVSGELAVAMLQSIATPTITWHNGYVQEDTTSIAAVFADQVLVSVSPVTASATLSVTEYWGIAEALFKPSAVLISSHGGSFTGTTGTYTLTESAAVNDLILVQWVCDNVGSAIVPTISDTINSGNYVPIGTAYYYAASTKSIGQSFMACNASGAPPVITITSGSINNGQYVITHYAGFSGIPTVDVVANTTGTGTSFTNSITTTQTLELAVTNTFSNTTISSTPSGWLSTLSGGNGLADQPYYQSLVATGTYSATINLTVSSFYNNWTFSFYSSTAGTVLPAAPGTFTMTGEAAVLTISGLSSGSLIMLVNPGAFDWVGAQANSLGQIFADYGVFTLSGFPATLFNSQNQAFSLVCNTGFFTMTGIDAVLQGPNYIVSLFTGFFTMTGFPATLTATGQSVIPPGFEAMPNLVGLDWLGASAVLWYGGFAELQPEIVKGTPLQMAEGLVIGQTPAAYAVVPNGCAVTLSVASSNLVSVSFESH